MKNDRKLCYFQKQHFSDKDNNQILYITGMKTNIWQTVQSPSLVLNYEIELLGFLNYTPIYNRVYLIIRKPHTHCIFLQIFYYTLPDWYQQVKCPTLNCLIRNIITFRVGRNFFIGRSKVDTMSTPAVVKLNIPSELWSQYGTVESGIVQTDHVIVRVVQ